MFARIIDEITIYVEYRLYILLVAYVLYKLTNIQHVLCMVSCMLIIENIFISIMGWTLLYVCTTIVETHISEVYKLIIVGIICVYKILVLEYSIMTYISMLVIIGLLLQFHILQNQQKTITYYGKYKNLIKNKRIIANCTDCSWTLEEFSPDTPVIALPCRHAFTNCETVQRWLSVHKSCPTCRAGV